jgi:hypothetical protein
MIHLRALLALALFLAQTSPGATDSTSPPLETLSPNLARLSGTDSFSDITYVRFFLLSDPLPGTPAALDLNRPTLTAQCTQDKKKKLRFELFVNFGSITDTAYYPPWQPTYPSEQPPLIQHVNVTMEFLGYTHFKPAKRQFEKVTAPYGQLRYNNPGVGSSNMEDLSYYLQVLRALPTLRVSLGPQSASFLTTPLLAQLHNDPLCRASRL